MLQCHSSTTYPASCQLHKINENNVCSEFLANKHVYIKWYEDEDYVNDVITDIRDVKNLFENLVVRHTFCSRLFIMLTCHAIFPRCYVSDTNEVKKQKVCKETCRLLHTDVCRTFFPYVRRYFEIEEYRLTELTMGTIKVLLKCKDLPSKFGSNDDTECFSYHDYNAVTNETCHGSSDIYVGDLNRTISNKSCHRWSDTCSNTHLIDLSNMQDFDSNYCRNPANYRNAPWCYTDYTTKEWDYCDVQHCPDVDGNYSSWSECTGPCGHRIRNCDNPVPKYGGKNCSHMGPDRDEEFCMQSNCALLPRDGDKKNLLLAILLPLCIVLTAGVCGLAWLYRRSVRKKDVIIPYESTALTEPKNIDKLIRFEHTPDEAEIIEQIKEYICSFLHCLCSTCIGAWLLNLIKNSGYKENPHMRDQIDAMIIDLKNTEGYDNLKRVCSSHVTGANSDTNNTDTESEQLRCDREKDELLHKAVDKWVKKHIVYDKLDPCKRTSSWVDNNDNRSDEGRILFGQFEIRGTKLVPLYDRLRNAKSNDDEFPCPQRRVVDEESCSSNHDDADDEGPEYHRIHSIEQENVEIAVEENPGGLQLNT